MENEFTARQVTTLVESFRNDISVIAEKVDIISTQMIEVKTDIKEIKSDLIIIKDVIRIEIPSLKNRVIKLES